MALDLESFSIREFAAKMRSLDLGGSWPFDGVGKEGDEARALPPISARRFRWWSDELDAAPSREAAAARADVDGSDRRGEEPAVETLAEKPLLSGGKEEEEEERPMRASWRNKQRAPKKKRSIAEIFALSPLIEGVEDESDGCGGDGVGDECERGVEGGGGGVGRDLGADIGGRDDEEGSRIGKESAEDEERIEKSSRKIEKKRKNKKKPKINKKPKMGISVPDKLKVQEGKLVDLHKRKPGKFRSLLKKQKLNYTRNAKLKLKNLEELVRNLPVRSRLKKRTRSTSTKKTKGTKLCSESAKSVSSSGVDGLIEDGKTCRSFELPQLKSLCDIFYGALAASSAGDSFQNGSEVFTGSLESQVKNMSNKDAVSKSVGRKDGAFSDKKYADSLLSIDSQRDFLGTSGNLLTEPIDLNQKYAGEPNALNPARELNLNSDSDMSLLGETRLQSTSDAAKEPPVSIENCAPNTDTVSSLSLLGDWSTALLTSRPQRGMEATKLDSCNSKRFAKLRISSDQRFPSREKRIHEEFNGLPLNSKGELIQLASCSGSAYNESLKKQILYPVYSTILSNHVELMSSQPKMKRNISCASLEEKDKPNKLLEQLSPAAEAPTSDLGFTGFQNSGKSAAQNHESNNKIWLSHSNSYQSEVSDCRCREPCRSQNCINGNKSICKFQPAVGQMLRLMGQNVTVGRQSKEHEASTEGKVWTDKEIILESRPSVRLSDISGPNGWPKGGPIHSVEALSEAGRGLLKESFLNPVEAPPSFYQMAASDTTFSQVQLKHQHESILKSGNSLEIGNYGYNTNLCSHSFPPHDSISGYLNGGMGYSSSTHYKHGRSVCCSAPFLSPPPIPNHESTSFARRPTAHSSASLPHWLLNAIQQREMQEPSCFYNDAAGLQGPCTIPGSNIFPLARTFHPPLISFPIFSFNISPAYGMHAPASFVRPSCVPLADTPCKMKTRVGTEYLSRKRRAEMDDRFMKMVKRPNLRAHAELNTPKEQESIGQLDPSAQNVIEASKHHANKQNNRH